MVELNIPVQDIEIKRINSKNYIFDFIRKKYLICTPEEWVRQNLVSYFVNNLNYPTGLIKTESSLKYNNLKKRSDILIFNNDMSHFMIVECKSYKLKLNKSHLNQSAIYNKIYKSGLGIENSKDISPRIQQSLLHWSYIVNNEHYELWKLERQK